MTPALELAARLRADGSPLSIETAEWLETVQKWLAGDNASALAVCAHCASPLTNEEIRSHVQSCSANPLVQEVKRLRAENADLDALCTRLSFGVDDTEDSTREAAEAAKGVTE